MISVTHITFDILVTEFCLTSLGMEPTASSLAIGSLGSLLPDIDTPKASLGRIFPLSFWIEHRWGHRTITHSWVFIFLSAILFSPLLFFKNYSLKNF